MRWYDLLGTVEKWEEIFLFTNVGNCRPLLLGRIDTSGIRWEITHCENHYPFDMRDARREEEKEEELVQLTTTQPQP
jgi:hypothetical protein